MVERRRGKLSCATRVIIYLLFATTTEGPSTFGIAKRGGAEEEVETYFCHPRKTNTNLSSLFCTPAFVLVFGWGAREHFPLLSKGLRSH